MARSISEQHIAANCRVRRRSSIINLRPSDIALAILKLALFSTHGDFHSAFGGVLMPFLPVLPEEQASDEVKKIYEYVSRRWGFLPNYFQALARDRQLLEDQVNLYTNAMFNERGLPKVIKEQIATVVSGINMSLHRARAMSASWVTSSCAAFAKSHGQKTGQTLTVAKSQVTLTDQSRDVQTLVGVEKALR